MLDIHLCLMSATIAGGEGRALRSHLSSTLIALPWDFFNIIQDSKTLGYYRYLKQSWRVLFRIMDIFKLRLADAQLRSGPIWELKCSELVCYLPSTTSLNLMFQWIYASQSHHTLVTWVWWGGQNKFHSQDSRIFVIFCLFFCTKAKHERKF